MEPKELILRDKYPIEDLRATGHALAKGKAGKEMAFKSGREMVDFFKKRIKK